MLGTCTLKKTLGLHLAFCVLCVAAIIICGPVMQTPACEVLRLLLQTRTDLYYIYFVCVRIVMDGVYPSFCDVMSVQVSVWYTRPKPPCWPNTAIDCIATFKTALTRIASTIKI